MHFWIDKRSSQLHGYGGGNRGRIPGPGGFYSRTFGQRHHHPPPLLRTQSQPPGSSSSSSNPGQSRGQHGQNSSNASQSSGQRAPSTIANATSTSVPGQSQGPASGMSISDSGGNQTHFNHRQGQTPHLSLNPMDSMMGMSSGNFTSGNQFDIYPPAIRLQGMRHLRGAGTGGYVMTSSPPTHVTSPPGGVGSPNEYYLGSTGGDPVIALSAGGGMGSSGLTGRRPRSHSHSASGPGPPGRRRSSSSGTASSGGVNQRRSTVNRWTYDPYNISHHQQIRHSHHAQMWPDGRPIDFMGQSGNPNNGEGGGSTDPSSNGILNPPHRMSTDLSSDSQNHSSNGIVLGGGSGGHGRGSTSTTSTRSIVDPAWKRTKRIGLTLCFMSFILMSTVAAKFVIEGPWLIDKSPRNERTEATIYFFLTEIIFVLFAMALFFAGVTCLRKRTNAYLLRQFNEYIMHTSPQVGGGRMGDYYGNTNGESGGGTGTGSNQTHQAPHISGLMSSQNLGNDRPFLGPHFLPSLESHLMNMHISVAESSNFVMTGLSKPPPYHIALYLPVPDEQCENPSPLRKDDTNLENIHNKHRLPQHMQNPSSSRLSSCLSGDNPDGDGDEPSDNKTDEDESGVGNGGESSQNQNQDGESGPRRKRRRDDNGDQDEGEDRAETPPPPYGQI